MKTRIPRRPIRAGVVGLASLLLSVGGYAQDLVPGQETPLRFPDLPPTLHAMWTGADAAPAMTVRLPDTYTTTNTYPLLVYVPGWHGHPAGNIGNARAIAGEQDWIVASVPLFKRTIDRDEVGGGLIVSFEDYPVLARAYQAMLGRVLEQVPNIDRDRSALVGFSNGAITIGILVSSHDPFIFDHFRNFCLVDQGMFHFVDIHKRGARDSRFLILVGDQPELGRDLKIRQAQLQQDAAQVLGVDVTSRILDDTGHVFDERHMRIVRDWLKPK